MPTVGLFVCWFTTALTLLKVGRLRSERAAQEQQLSTLRAEVGGLMARLQEETERGADRMQRKACVP
jgi:hypothetical protein